MSPSTQIAMDTRFMSQSISERAIRAPLQDWNRTDTHAVANYEKHEAPLITLRVSRHPAGTLGERIRKKRLLMGLKQVALASLLGVHEMTIVNWETGKTRPSGARLDLVREFLRGKLPRRRSSSSRKSRVS